MSDMTKNPPEGIKGAKPVFATHVEDLGPVAAETICAGMKAANENVPSFGPSIMVNSAESSTADKPSLNFEKPLGRLLGEPKHASALQDVLSQLRALCLAEQKPAPVFEVIKGARDER